MLTFLVLVSLMTGAAKWQDRTNPRAIAVRIDNGTATDREKVRFIKYTEKILAKAERRFARN